MAGLRLVHHGSSFVAASLLLSSAAMAFDDFAARAHQGLPGTGAVRSLALQLDGSAVPGTGTGSDGLLLRYLCEETGVCRVAAALALAAAARRTCGGTGDGVRDHGGEKA